MRTHLWILFPAALSLAACGIPQDQYDAATAKGATCEKNLADREKTLAERDALIADQKKQLDDAQGLLKDAEVKLKAQGTDLAELAELRKQKAAADARARLFDDLVAKLKSMINAGKLAVTIRRGQIVVALDTDVLFDPGKTELKKDGKAEIADLAKVLLTLDGRRFQVAGHTDNVPIHTKEFPSNWELSTARAVEVVKILLKEGVKEGMLSAAGYSDADPASPNTTPESRAKNRRIEIVLVPNVEELGLKQLGAAK